MRTRFSRPAAVAGLVVTLMLTACGGGGGGDGAGGGGDATPAPVVSNLLPSAPAIGATLHADATTLRPLIDGARLAYHGVTNAAGHPASYANIAHQVAEGGGVRESHGNLFNEGEEPGVPVFVQGGTVKSVDSLQLVEGAKAEPIEYIELRSPVRVNDRYVMLDKRIADSGGDFDGDRTNDPMDVAMWADVIGTEVLDLPSRNAVAAVRVDTRLRSRVQYSSNKAYSPVVDITISTWYAAGIGVVKMRLDAPGDSPGAARVTAEEVLVRWDAGDRGLGYSTSELLAAKGGGITGAFLRDPLGAVAFDSHAVVLTHIPNEPQAAGFTLNRLNSRGQMTATAVYRYADLPGFAGGAVSPRLLRVGNSLRVVLASDSGIHMFGFNETGQQLISANPATLTADKPYAPSGGSLFQASAKGDRLWLAWMGYPRDEDGQHRSTVRLQAFNADGAAAAPPQTVEAAVTPGAFTDWTLQASASRAVLTYAIAASPAKRWHYAAANASSGLLMTGRVLEPLSQPSLCGNTLQPLLLDSVSLLGCTAWQQGNGVLTLNADMTPVMVGGSIRVEGWLDDNWRSNQGPPTATADGDKVFIETRHFKKQWSGDVLDSAFMDVGEADASNMATPRRLARFPANELITPVFTLGMGNRLLIVGSHNGLLTTMLIWR